MSFRGVYLSYQQHTSLRNFTNAHQGCAERSPRHHIDLELYQDGVIYCECPTCKAGVGFGRDGAELVSWQQTEMVLA